jgi:phospho-N-acetylmuramoyl-pentapeptide-transferase
MRRLKYGQTILDIGPNWHKNKQGIPTMGGIQFAAGITVAVLVGFFLIRERDVAISFHSVLDDVRILLGLVMALAYGFIGFIDDYIKVIKKRNLGLSAPQKMVMQFGVGIIYLAGLWIAGDTTTIVFLPFLGQLDMGMIYYLLALLGIVYMVNVVNITDGIDGLCSSVTLVVALGMMTCAMILRIDGMRMMAAALAGGCVGFLIWNFHPAKIFMGDTGSMFLGGMVVALAFGIGIPVFLIFLGMIYIVEGLSVMIQTTYFKYTRKRTGEGKRLFKMSPIHHHYEMSGWSETKIVCVFSLVQAVFCVLAVLAVLRI